ncbi:hypothetical protein K1T71_005003 [Dendrolimus kikuchii]|uniref:Uncharacterized protein n=1 Tax=Dendrolimus kikuchii TaxID=765133 RepID=A0ACC1D5Z5_9NEOP|nr:hypothetical protein K1T71_005003 [Dendrolimus kikuchii]
MRVELAEARLHRPGIATIPAENSVFAKNQPPAWLEDLIAEIRSSASSTTIREPGIVTAAKDKFLPTQHPMVRPATTLPATTQPPTTQPPASLPSTSTGSKAKKVKTPTADASKTNPSAPVAPTTQPTIPQEEGWTVVTKKKKKGKRKTEGKSKQSAQHTRGTQESRKKPQKKPAAAQLKQPPAQAVVIKLQPEAEKRGITYAERIPDRVPIEVPNSPRGTHLLDYNQMFPNYNSYL